MIELREVLAARQHEFSRLMREYPHEGDPCVHCNVPHDDVLSGPCIPHLVSKNDGSIDDAMKSFAAKETVVREGLAKIEAGIEGIVSMMSPTQRSMVFKELDSIFSGVTMIEGVTEIKHDNTK